MLDILWYGSPNIHSKLLEAIKNVMSCDELENTTIRENFFLQKTKQRRSSLDISTAMKRMMLWMTLLMIERMTSIIPLLSETYSDMTSQGLSTIS